MNEWQSMLFSFFIRYLVHSMSYHWNNNWKKEETYDEGTRCRTNVK